MCIRDSPVAIYCYVALCYSVYMCVTLYYYTEIMAHIASISIVGIMGWDY